MIDTEFEGELQLARGCTHVLYVSAAATESCLTGACTCAHPHPPAPSSTPTSIPHPTTHPHLHPPIHTTQRSGPGVDEYFSRCANAWMAVGGLLAVDLLAMPPGAKKVGGQL